MATEQGIWATQRQITAIYLQLPAREGANFCKLSNLEKVCCGLFHFCKSANPSMQSRARIYPLRSVCLLVAVVVAGVAGQTFLHGWTEKVAATRFCALATLAAFLMQVTDSALEALQNIKSQLPGLSGRWVLGDDLRR